MLYIKKKKMISKEYCLNFYKLTNLYALGNN